MILPSIHSIVDYFCRFCYHIAFPFSSTLFKIFSWNKLVWLFAAADGRNAVCAFLTFSSFQQSENSIVLAAIELTVEAHLIRCKCSKIGHGVSRISNKIETLSIPFNTHNRLWIEHKCAPLIFINIWMFSCSVVQLCTQFMLILKHLSALIHLLGGLKTKKTNDAVDMCIHTKREPPYFIY